MIQVLYFLFGILLAVPTFGQVVAKIGSEEITLKELNKAYQIAKDSSSALPRPPTKAEVLEDLIRFKIGLKEAKRRKLESDPQVKQALEQELYKGLLEKSLASDVEKIRVYESEMKKYYREYPDLRTSHILIRYPLNASKKQIAEARKRADKIYGTVKTKKKTWSAYVRLYSEDELNSKTGGDTGYHNESSVHPRYYRAAQALKMGEISPPIRSLYGFHIIKLTGKKNYTKTDKGRLKIRVFNQKRFRIMDRFFERLKKNYKVSKYKANIK